MKGVFKMLKAFQIILLVVLVSSYIGVIADEKRKEQLLTTLGMSGALFLLSLLIEGIVAKI